MSKLYKNAALTHELRRLAGEVVTIADDGTQVTREEQLASLIWKQALGWVEKARDGNGTLQEIVHKPVAWAQQFLWERIEGRAVVATPTQEGGTRAADKVRALSRERVNAMAKSKVGPPAHIPRKAAE